LNLVVNNRPTGEEYRSSWGGATSVILETDQDVITRLRSDSENVYILNDQEFKANKTEVPEEIVKALNLNEINLQRQLDSPFLLSQTPGAVAEFFNRIANLDQIDKATQSVNSSIRKITSSIESKAEQRKSAKEDLQNYKNLDEIEVEVEILERLEKDLYSQNSNLSVLKRLITQIERTNDQIEEIEPMLEMEPILNGLLEKVSIKKEKEAELSRLSNICREIKEKDREIRKSEAIIPAGDKIDSLLILIREFKQKEQDHSKLSELLRKIEDCSDNIAFMDEEYTKLHKQFEQEMGDVCLLCGQPIKTK
jgi:hypothetical protein